MIPAALQAKSISPPICDLGLPGPPVKDVSRDRHVDRSPSGPVRDIGLTADDRSADLSVFVGALFVVGGVILLAGTFKIATAPASGSGSLASLLDPLENIEPAGAYKIGVGWLLDAVFDWIKSHLRGTAIAVFAIFGIVFLLKGLAILG